MEKPGYIILIVLTAVFLIVALVFNSLTFLDAGSNVFQSTPANISDKYILDITPAGWTFSIWSVIYIFQVLWVIYTHTLLCRHNKLHTGTLYYDPPFLPPTFFVIYMMNLILNVTWLFSFDSEFLAASFVGLFGIAMTLYICLFFSFKLLWDYEPELSKTEMILNIILVQNGLGLYATWTTVATILNFGFVLRYDGSVAMDTTCYICLVILLAGFLIYFFSDILIATKRFRYFLAPYLVLIVALSGIVDKNWDSGSGVQIFVAVILAVAIFGLLGKIVSIFYYRTREPLSLEK